MRAANYYFQHLDKQVQVVVVSDATTNQQTASGGMVGHLSKPVASKQQATDSAVPLATIGTSDDDELDKLLQGGGPEDFDVGALRPLQSCSPVETPQTPHVWCLVCYCLCWTNS